MQFSARQKMKRQIRFLKSEQGQSIVIVAAALVALLALAGLAIDGGNLFLQRRNTQNAADAAALAGTRVLAQAICNDPNATDGAIATTVNHYAQLNGIQDLSGLTASYTDRNEAELGPVGAGSVPQGATGILVDIKNSVPSYFIQVIGIEEVDVAAAALAMTGPLNAGGGVRPIGIPSGMLGGMDEGDGFTINFGNCIAQPDQCIVAHTGGQIQHRGWLNLAYVWNPTEYTGPCTDADDDNQCDEEGYEDFEWPRAIDPSADADVLKEWMANGWDGPPLYTGDYIHAKPGKDSSVIGEAAVGEIFILPVFDEVPYYEDIEPAKAPKANQGGDFYYHIVGFMAFKVTDFSQGGGTISGVITRVIMGNGQVSTEDLAGYGQADACDTHLQAVNLWR
jgi:hypothetical protein